MPCYEFSCETTGCFETVKEWRAKWTPEKPTCPTHGATMERDYHGEARRHVPGAAFPFVTKNITGAPIEIRDQAQLSRLLREHNLVQRDDAAFAEPAEEKYSFGRYNRETGNWDGRGVQRREGRAGGKGRWI